MIECAQTLRTMFAVKFAASLRLRLYPGKGYKNAGTQIGREVTIKCVKNKLSAPFRKVRLRFDFETGWDDAWSTLNYAKELQLVPERARGEKAVTEARAALDACDWLPERAASVGTEREEEEEK